MGLGAHLDRLLTCNTKSPVVKDIGNPDQDCQTSQRKAREQYLASLKFILDLFDPSTRDFLRCCFGYGHICIPVGHRRVRISQYLKALQGDAALPTIELGNFLKHLYRSVVPAPVEQELWRLLETKHNEA